MKKIYLSIVLLMCVTVGFAQPFVRFGFQAGVNFADIKFSGNEEFVDDEDDQKMTTSFQVGALADIMFSDRFSIQPEVKLSGKGTKFSYEGSQGGESWEGTQKINIMYVEVPVNAVFKFNSLYLGAGPYAAFAVSGKTKWEETYTFDEGGETVTETESESEDLNFGSEDDDDFKSTDFGVNFVAGYEMGMGLGIGVNYGLGLSNILPGTNDDYKGKNNVISISLRYLL